LNSTVVATLALDEVQQEIVRQELGGAAQLLPLVGLGQAQRRDALGAATALLCRNTGKELFPGEAQCLDGVKLVQFINSGLDFVRLSEIPSHVPIASNKGAYAQPMAEHGMAMALAASKRLFVEHRALQRAEFNMFTPNKLLAGGVCGILGLGGVGQAIAPLARAFGMKVHAINRRGVAGVQVDRIGTPENLHELLRASDVLFLCAPLTGRTHHVIGASELALMKPDAILVNLARADLIDEAALYAHLVARPGFFACIDTWWLEPSRNGVFATTTPVLELPNVIGSPHNSASVPGSLDAALRASARNIRRLLDGAAPLNRLHPEERVPPGTAPLTPP